MSIKLPEGATEQQIEMYNRNCELYILAIKNMNRFGVIWSMCAGLGSQDLDLTYNETRFLSVYPYDYHWYMLAYGKDFSDATS